MSQCERFPRHRGLMLINLLVTLGLMTAFVIVAERVFRLSLLTASKTALRQEESLRVERAMDALRADVWSATGVQVVDKSRRLRIAHGDAGAAVEWTSNVETGDLVRVADKDRQEWKRMGIAFERQGGLLSVSRGGAEVALFRQAPTGGAR
ncbi:MAG TPA: hypothetical protein VH475_00825 [Tepidisphaeraceae bacterium]